MFFFDCIEGREIGIYWERKFEVLVFLIVGVVLFSYFLMFVYFY